jgi:hypothetical protein
MSLATKKVLEKEVEVFKSRIEFLNKWITNIKTNDYATEGDRFTALNDVYKLENERDFKATLVGQRVKQIEQINQQEELKEKASIEIPELVNKAEEVLEQMRADLIALKSSKPLKKEAKEERLQGIKMISLQIDQIDSIVMGCIDRYQVSNTHTGLLADFRVLNDVLKLKK